jgi:hypothetical protein
MPKQLSSTIVLCVAAALTLTACGEAKPATRSSTGSPPPAAAPTSPEPAPPTKASTVPPTTRTSTGAAAASACPVTETALLKALSGTDIADRGSNPKKLAGIRCYRDYALATDGTPSTTHELATFLFGYRRPENRWVPLNLGTDNICEGFVLDQDVRQHLGNPSCG